MLGKDFGLGAADPYYFKFIPNMLQLQKGDAPEGESAFRFLVYKGVQKFDESKTAIQANFKGKKLSINDVQLNFYLPNFMPNRKVDFTIKVMEGNGAEETQVGTVVIETSKVVSAFKETKSNSSVERVNISDKYGLQYELFIEKTKYNLDKLVSSFKGEAESSSNKKREQPPTRSSGIKSLAKSVDSEDVQAPEVIAEKPKPVQRTNKDLTKSVDKQQIHNPSTVHTSQDSEVPSGKTRTREQSETSSQKRGGYTSHRKDETSSSKQSGPKEAVRKMKAPSERQESIRLPQGKSTAPIHYQVGQMKSSRHISEAEKQQKQKTQSAGNKTEITYIIKVAVFFVVSLYLIFNAMTPAKRYNSKKISRK